MRRRSFLAKTSFAFSGLIWVPKALADIDQNDPAFIAEPAPTGGGGSGPTWYDAEPEATTDSTAFSGADSIEWTPITIGQTGNISQIRIYVPARFGAGNLKLAVFDNSGNIITQSSAGDPGPGWVAAYYSVSVPNGAVTNGQTIRAAWSSDSINLSFRYLNGVGTYDYNNTAGNYASFAPASLPTSSGPLSRRYAIGVYVS